MKVAIYFDSAMCTVALPARESSGDVIEVPDEEWSEFERVEARYEEMLSRFSDLLSQRNKGGGV